MKKFRLIFEKDKEEDWLNRMSDKGWALSGYFLGVYTFEPCYEGEYVYQLDLLQGWSGDKDGYLSSIKDKKVEFVYQWYRWICLRKRAADGSFELYSDSESKSLQYQRIRNLFLIVGAVEVYCATVQFILNGDMHIFNLVVGCLASFVAVLFFKVAFNANRKMKQINRKA